MVHAYNIGYAGSAGGETAGSAWSSATCSHGSPQFSLVLPAVLLIRTLQSRGQQRTAGGPAAHLRTEGETTKTSPAFISFLGQSTTWSCCMAQSDVKCAHRLAHLSTRPPAAGDVVGGCANFGGTSLREWVTTDGRRDLPTFPLLPDLWRGEQAAFRSCCYHASPPTWTGPSTSPFVLTCVRHFVTVVLRYQYCVSQVWTRMPVISELGRQTQEDWEFKAIFLYIGS